MIVIEDGLASNAPHINLLKELKIDYILGCKQGDHKFLFKFIEDSEKLNTVGHSHFEEDGIQHDFRSMNEVCLNDSNPECLVNFIEYKETKKGKTRTWSWVTNIELTEDNLMKIMKGGRARWKIENETFNTLKNLGYNFEHNFGHGHQNLSNNLAILMMVVFLIDQLQQLACKIFKAAQEKEERLSYLWDTTRQYFNSFTIKNWEIFYRAITVGRSKLLLPHFLDASVIPDTKLN